MKNDAIKYTKTHEWVKREGNVAVIGVSEFAQSALGDVVYVSEIKSGTEVKSGDMIATIDSVKVSAELYAPVSGRVLEFNNKLIANPELVNNDAVGAGWIVKIAPSSPDEWDVLLSADDYMALVGGTKQE